MISDHTVRSGAVGRIRGTKSLRERNNLREEDRTVHDWYRFVLSFPPHLVRTYVERFGIDERSRVLDPFCGTGTTLVECKKLGISSVGIEANPIASFASKVKVDWSVDPDALEHHAHEIADMTSAKLDKDGIDDYQDLPLFGRDKGSRAGLRKLPPLADKLLIKNSISPLPLHKVLVLVETMQDLKDDRFGQHERLALAKSLVSGVGNLVFGPEVGVGSPKRDAPVVGIWLDNVKAMAKDLRSFHGRPVGIASVRQGDSSGPTSLK